MSVCLSCMSMPVIVSAFYFGALVFKLHCPLNQQKLISAGNSRISWFPLYINFYIIIEPSNVNNVCQRMKGKKKTTNTINKMLLHSKTRTILKQPCHSSLTFHKLQLPLAQALFNPLNPLTPVSDQDQISPYNINTILTR